MAETTSRRRKKATPPDPAGRSTPEAPKSSGLRVTLSSGEMQLTPVSGEAHRYAVGFILGVLADAIGTGVSSRQVLAMRVASIILKSRVARDEMLLLVAQSSGSGAEAFLRRSTDLEPSDYVKLCGALLSLYGASSKPPARRDGEGVAS